MGDNVLLLRFNDHDSDSLVRPVDSIGNLAELVATGAAPPDIVEAELGYGRRFVSANLDGLAAQDIDSGSTLLTRNASIRVALSWDLEATAAGGAPATIYARGKGTSAAEYVSAGLELRVIDAASRIAEVRWIWMDLAGALQTQVGGHFQPPTDGELLITATRRWVSSSSVVLRYYLGDALLAEVESTDGEIGGGTTGTTSIGTRYTGAAWGRHFDGVIDELQVVDDELSAEEVRATWNRITVEQPRGYQMLVEAHDPGFPISRDRSSRAQKETRMFGHALGYASAQAENVRENILPDRAYGDVLSRWEAITKQSPKPGDDVDTRRRRVVGKIRQRLGVSIPGVGDAIDDLLDTDPANLEIVAFDQTTRDTWDDLNELRWRHDPSSATSSSSSTTDIQKTSGADGWNGYAESVQTFAGDFSVTFTVDGVPSTSGITAVGIGPGSPATLSWEHGLTINIGLPGVYSYLESGTPTGASDLFVDGDELTLQRVGTTVSLLRNGTLLYTFPTASGGGTCRIFCEFYDLNSKILDIYAEDAGSPTPLTWQNDVNVTITTTSIADSAEWSAAGTLLGQSQGIKYAWSDWMTSLQSIGGDGRGAAMISKLTPTTIQTQGEAGLVFIDRAARSAFLFGMRNDAGTYRLVTESMIAGTLQGSTNRAAPGLVPVWLRMYHDEATGTMKVAYATAAASGPFTEIAGIASGVSSFQWAGFYIRTFTETAADIEVEFDDTAVRAPYGDRAFRFYVVRDPAEPGSPDYVGANAVLRGLRQAHTLGYAVRTLTALYDDDSTGYDLEPMGGV